MDGILDILVIVGLFLLRLAAPLVITLVVAYLMRRLDAKWETEARKEAVAPDASKVRAAQKPCWEEKGCSEAQRAHCPACKWGDLPCWLARTRAENRLPAECPDCPRFGSKLQPQAVPV